MSLTKKYQKMIALLAEQGAEFYNALKESEEELSRTKKENQELRTQLAKAKGQAMIRDKYPPGKRKKIN